MTDNYTKALWDRMRELHATGKELPEDWLEKAEALEKAAKAYYGQEAVSPAKFLGCWARARRMWCKATGEPLV